MSVDVVVVGYVDVDSVDLGGVPVDVGTPIVMGPRGPAGPAGAGGTVYDQTIAVASVVIPHTLGRRPVVEVYVAGELVDADVSATLTTVTISWPSPRTFSAVLI